MSVIRRINRVGTRITCCVASLAAVALTACSTPADTTGPADIGTTIRNAYDYAFPLYFLSQYRWNALHTTGGRTSTTLNRYAHSRAVATPDDTWANAPIVDALYSTAWIDLARGPVFVNTPDTGSRYYVLTLIDFYSNTFFYAGQRTTGTAAQKYLLVGPDWKGDAPQDVSVVHAPTDDVYVNLRVQTTGPADQAAVDAVQDGFTIDPAGTPGPESAARVKPVQGDPKNYLAVVNQMLALDPPPARDRSLLEKYRQVGICGTDCSWDKLPQSIRDAWTRLYPRLGDYMKQYASATAAAKGWIDYNPPGSLLGTTDQHNYARRALALGSGTGMLGLRREEADYWITFTDATGKPMLGSGEYVLHLPPGGIPAKAFWSVSLYEVEDGGQFLTPNPIDRYEIASNTTDLVTNPDGSIDIRIQSSAPTGDHRPNWLPSPADGRQFILFARSYIPGDRVLSGAFTMPPVSAAG
ncbi:DUF1254 domain-containing protein [Nocardia sp. NEAU-G5]|uniref:DUF1254 domain-containing protein n=1 Tax=Nocardia albiluteola TaxID=2842303 RepID=A0ABS6BCV9_9NOCA|nr:DUF1254 domain-containing protein [Nocardia albiluteola]MBU3067301.1 DUF1254 domain-containing protein [Nocardia albiluteola]